MKKDIAKITSLFEVAEKQLPYWELRQRAEQKGLKDKEFFDGFAEAGKSGIIKVSDDSNWTISLTSKTKTA